MHARMHTYVREDRRHHASFKNSVTFEVHLKYSSIFEIYVIPGGGDPSVLDANYPPH